MGSIERYRGPGNTTGPSTLGARVQESRNPTVSIEQLYDEACVVPTPQFGATVDGVTRSGSGSLAWRNCPKPGHLEGTPSSPRTAGPGTLDFGVDDVLILGAPPRRGPNVHRPPRPALDLTAGGMMARRP